MSDRQLAARAILLVIAWAISLAFIFAMIEPAKAQVIDYPEGTELPADLWDRPAPPPPVAVPMTADVPCSPSGILSPALNGTYVMFGQAGWGALTYQQTGATIEVTAVTPSGQWGSGSQDITPGVGEVVIPIWSTGGPTQLVGQIKLCRGPNFGQGPELRSRAVLDGSLIVPAPVNDCPPGQTAFCLQRFHAWRPTED